MCFFQPWKCNDSSFCTQRAQNVRKMIKKHQIWDPPSVNLNSENLQILHGFINQTKGGVLTQFSWSWSRDWKLHFYKNWRDSRRRASSPSCVGIPLLRSDTPGWCCRTGWTQFWVSSSSVRTAREVDSQTVEEKKEKHQLSAVKLQEESDEPQKHPTTSHLIFHPRSPRYRDLRAHHFFKEVQVHLLLLCDAFHCRFHPASGGRRRGVSGVGGSRGNAVQSVDASCAGVVGLFLLLITGQDDWGEHETLLNVSPLAHFQLCAWSERKPFNHTTLLICAKSKPHKSGPAWGVM